MLHASDFGLYKTKPLVMATAYDYCFASIMEEAGVDIILVGDSLANVVLGFPSTRDVGMDIMEIFVGAVCRGAPETHITADMPYGSDKDPHTAVRNARRFLKVGAHSVKLEGAKIDAIRALKLEGISVIGHLGLLPQTAQSFKQVGHNPSERKDALRSADSLCEAGAMALVLEHMDAKLAAEITERVPVPTIGIGAGNSVDGQVLVQHDLLGMSKRAIPKFARKFADLREAALHGVRDYSRAVRDGSFPE